MVVILNKCTYKYEYIEFNGTQFNSQRNGGECGDVIYFPHFHFLQFVGFLNITHIGYSKKNH